MIRFDLKDLYQSTLRVTRQARGGLYGAFLLYIIVFALLLFALSERSFALSGFTVPSQTIEWQASDSLKLGTFGSSTTFELTSPSWHHFKNPFHIPQVKVPSERSRELQYFLDRAKLRGFSTGIHDFFRSLGVKPGIEIRTVAVSDAMSFGLNQGIQGRSFDHRFLVHSIPICDVHARSHQLSDGSALLMGDVPQIEGTATDVNPSEWPELEWTQNFFKQSMVLDPEALNTDSPNGLKFFGAEKCYLVRNQKLHAVWKFRLRLMGNFYSAVADQNKVYKFEPAYFNVDGTATTWAQNRSTEPNAKRTLFGLVGNGTLTSEFLKTVVPENFSRAVEPTHVFNYPVSDRRIEEVTAFANAQDHLRWFQNLGFTWYGVKPLEVRIHFRPQNKPNNALFEPGDDATNTPPTITIDDGDGVELQNLVTDGDVVSHELGHHIIFKTLKNVSGESLVLHEGLADFFVFARTGDPCLGETICPADSGQCQQRGRCLRSAANRMVYKDSTWTGFSNGRPNVLGHLHGQLISGMMWDMRSSSQLPGDELPKLVLKATSYFAESSNFCQFIRALYAADRELSGGKYQELIKYVATERGFAEFADTSKECPSGSLTTAEQNVALKQKEKSKTEVKCGTIGAVKDNFTFGTLILFLAPIFYSFFSLLKKRHSASKYLAFTLAGGALFTLSPPTEASAAKEESRLKEFPEATLTLSMMLHWEGRPILPENVLAVEALRKKFPKLDIVHLISPSYFVRSPEEAAQAYQAMEKIIRTNDSYGLLLGSWKSLVTQSGAIFRTSPTFWGSALTMGQCQKSDCGSDIPLHLYPEKDIEKIMQYSLETLEKKALGRPLAFAVTGWMSSPTIVEIAKKNGLIYDFSPVAPESLEATMSYYPLLSWVKGLWNHVKPHTEPLFRETPHGRILLFPQSMAGIDHQPAGSLVERVNASVSEWSKNQASKPKKLSLPIVFYLETAEDIAPRIEAELETVLAIADNHKLRILKQTFANIPVAQSLSSLQGKKELAESLVSSKDAPAKTPSDKIPPEKVEPTAH